MPLKPARHLLALSLRLRNDLLPSRGAVAAVSVTGMNAEDAGSNTGERCKHDMIPGYCGLCRVPSTSEDRPTNGHKAPGRDLIASSCSPTSIPPRIVSRPQGTEHESPSLEAGSSLQAIPAISRRR
jgi:hypothetical protein